MRSKGMTEGMRRNGFIDPSEADRLLDGTLEYALILVVPHDLARLRIDRALTGRKSVLPAGFTACIGIFPSERIGQMNFSIAFLKVSLMKVFYFLNVRF